MTGFDRLHHARDIRAVFDARTVAHGGAMALHARRRPDDGGPGRATVVAGRKLGDAVRRNRAKRRLRAALHQTAAPSGLDVVVIARSRALTAKFPDLIAEAERLLARVGEGTAPVPHPDDRVVRSGT